MIVRIYYYGKTVIGILSIIIFGWMYLLNPENLNFASAGHWIGVDIFWAILLADLLWRFIPGKAHHIGQQKYLKRNFVPSKAYQDNKGLSEKEHCFKKTTDRRALLVVIVFGAMNILWLIFYILGIFRPQELFGIMLLYFIGDMICVLGFCPFRLIFLRNRCCNVCRIYNWDSLMLVTPLVLVPSLYSWTLGAVALVYTVVWEVSYHRHPERFCGSSNMSLGCNQCKHGLCPYRFRKNKKEDEEKVS